MLSNKMHTILMFNTVFIDAQRVTLQILWKKSFDTGEGSIKLFCGSRGSCKYSDKLPNKGNISVQNKSANVIGMQ